ncbi:MAG: hypothetical protein SW833_08395 [Cyanobacteriota bacterium]|nr:hypothetical protein [Cyanobacteriota bacterium]
MSSCKLQDLSVSDSYIRKEADIVVTATVLGFIVQRVNKNQKCQFDWETPSPKSMEEYRKIDEYQKKNENKYREIDPKSKEEYEQEFLPNLQRFLEVLRAMSIVIEEYGELKDGQLSSWITTEDDKLKDGQSPSWREGAVVIGIPLESKQEEKDKLKKLAQGDPGLEETELGIALGELVSRQPKEMGAKSGRGAYTGMLLAKNRGEQRRQIIQSTHRVIVGGQGYEYPIWTPGSAYENWGMMGKWKVESSGQFSKTKEIADGCGPMPESRKELTTNERIGYLHGMSMAIGACRELSQDQYYPVEMAVGTETTKMASCFACATYMYAAGYEPSSIHLGRAESWVAPSKGLRSAELADLIKSQGGSNQGEKLRGLMYVGETQKKEVSQWRQDIGTYIKKGVSILYEMSKKSGIALGYVEPLVNLKAVIEKAQETENVSSEIFLDALTVHEKDWIRIERVLDVQIGRLTIGG